MAKDQSAQEVYRFFKPQALPVKFELYDFYVPFFVTAETVSEAATLAIYPSDVWIVTYPKAGTTWTQQIVKLVRNNGVNDGQQLSISVPWPLQNSGILQPKLDLDALPKPRSFKSHMPYSIMSGGLPSTNPCKYIYVSRNPKDTAVSFYYHYCRLICKHDDSINLPWDLFFRYFMDGNTDFGDFFDHNLSWWAHRDDGNVLFLMFEDMKKDLPAAVAKIAKFIGADISDEGLAKVVDQTSFNAMKKDDTANYSFTDKIAKPGSQSFIRKGEVGDWKNLFTAEQSAEMDKMCQERLAGTGLMFDFGN